MTLPWTKYSGIDNEVGNIGSDNNLGSCCSTVKYTYVIYVCYRGAAVIVLVDRIDETFYAQDFTIFSRSTGFDGSCRQNQRNRRKN